METPYRNALEAARAETESLREEVADLRQRLEEPGVRIAPSPAPSPPPSPSPARSSSPALLVAGLGIGLLVASVVGAIALLAEPVPPPALAGRPVALLPAAAPTPGERLAQVVRASGILEGCRPELGPGPHRTRLWIHAGNGQGTVDAEDLDRPGSPRAQGFAACVGARLPAVDLSGEVAAARVDYEATGR